MFPDQLTINKMGAVKRGTQRVDVADLHHGTDDYLKVSTVWSLQNEFPTHTIWLVGDLIHTITMTGTFREVWYRASKLETYFKMKSENLNTLAGFLDRLDQAKFDISYFAFDEHGEQLDIYAHDCMTVGCAIGWGPAAGLPILSTDSGWADYSRRVFGLHPDDIEWDWCFSGVWQYRDNTATGAAKRIRHLVQHGLPENSEKQRWGDEPYMFAEAA